MQYDYGYGDGNGSGYDGGDDDNNARDDSASPSGNSTAADGEYFAHCCDSIITVRHCAMAVLMAFALGPVGAQAPPCQATPISPYPTPYPILTPPSEIETEIQLPPNPPGHKSHWVSDYGGWIQGAVDAAAPVDTIIVDTYFPMLQLVFILEKSRMISVSALDMGTGTLLSDSTPPARIKSEWFD